MTYIIERNHRFYVVAYEGIDPLTGRERRRWHPAGRSRTDADAIAAALEHIAPVTVETSSGPVTVARFLTEQWMPRRRPQLGATTAHRYQWMTGNYINPRVGDIPLRALRVEHLDHLYDDLLTHDSHNGGELASKTCTTSTSSSAPHSPTPPGGTSSSPMWRWSPMRHALNNEAMTNAVRHSSGRMCLLRVTSREGTVDLEVTDDGVGTPQSPPAGVGLTSIRERTAELGGTCTFEAIKTGGTRLRVVLPTGG